jgi:hypothetical protein
MFRKRPFLAAIGSVAFAGLLLAVPLNSQQSATPPSIDGDDIGGLVKSSNGPEAGVWVIAETSELPTRFTRMVVTDENGRYVLPDLPKATYNVWVRGYGLVDSPKVKAVPGKNLNLKAVIAPNDSAAAQYYPGIYWYSMMKIPDESTLKSSKVAMGRYLTEMKNRSCVGCHQLGQLSTRTFPRNVPFPLNDFKTSEEAWFRRVQSGQSGDRMFQTLVKDLNGIPFKYLADWTDRVAKGELPHAKPERPQGVERNIVVTTWDWLDEKHYLHDLIASDRRYPTVNANGPLATRSCSRRRTGELKKFGTPKPIIITVCSTRRDGCGLPPDFAMPTIRTFAKRDPIILPRSFFHWSELTDNLRSSIRRPISTRS